MSGKSIVRPPGYYTGHGEGLLTGLILGILLGCALGSLVMLMILGKPIHIPCG